MFGSAVTSGLLQKRGSFSAFSIMNGSGVMMVWAQNATALAVRSASRPVFPAKICSSRSTSDRCAKDIQRSARVPLGEAQTVQLPQALRLFNGNWKAWHDAVSSTLPATAPKRRLSTMRQDSSSPLSRVAKIHSSRGWRAPFFVEDRNDRERRRNHSKILTKLQLI